MKNLINKTFLKLKKENRPALVTYTVAGDPNKNQSLTLLKRISKHVDIVEWGFPHNCPTADGKEIQNSSYRALENGIKLNDIFNLVKKYKKDKNAKPLILMGYYQMVFNYGEEKFVNKCRQVGVDGLIIVDLIWPYNKKDWPELYWNKNENIEIISNETILNSVFLGETLPNYLDNLSFNNLKLKLGPDFKLQYSELVHAYLDTKLDLNINGKVGKDLNARGLIYLKKGRANLYTTPFKLDKNKDNYILFASRSGVVPFINFSLVSKVPDSIIPISQNNQDTNISNDLDVNETSSGLGSFGIGNSRLIKIEASYEGFLDQLSFADENRRIQLRSTPSYNRSQIIGLIGGNSANLINRAFISQLNNADAFSERFQLSLYPALIENNDSLNNIFSNENLDIENDGQSTSNEEFSSQAWVAELGIDVTDAINFAFQTVPGRDDVPPTGILTFQANPNLELLGSYDSNGDWKSQVQLFFRY